MPRHVRRMREAAADLVLVGGQVVTMAGSQAAAAAVAIRDGRIVEVGPVSEVRALTGPRTEVVELAGKTVLPGINDSHIHLTELGATRPPLGLDLSPAAVSSIADVAGAVRAAVRELPPGAWVRGFGWDSGRLEECRTDPERMPTRWDLDPGSPVNPVALTDYSGHALLVNSRALELAEITAGTSCPAGSEIVLDAASGQPTGLLKETGATGLVGQRMPPLTDDELRRAIVSAAATLHRLGITSVTEPGLGPGGEHVSGGVCGSRTLEAFARLAADARLPLRVTALLLFGADGSCSAGDVRRGLEGISLPAFDPAWLRVGGVKIFADGVPQLHTAWMHEEYAGSGRGSLVVAGDDERARCDELAEMIRVAHRSGQQIGVHATGDAAIDATVAAFVAAMAADPRPEPRHYLIHGDFAGPATLRTMASRSVGLNVQPQIKTASAEAMDELFGMERSACQWPLRSAIDAGVNVSFSSDAPVTFPDWREGIAAALTRVAGSSGRVSGPEQRVGLDDALRAYTRSPAWQDFAEGWKGTLEVGKVADVCVLDGDLLSTGPHEIPALPVALTILGGKVVYDASG